MAVMEVAARKVIKKEPKIETPSSERFVRIRDTKKNQSFKQAAKRVLVGRIKRKNAKKIKLPDWLFPDD